MSELGPVQEPSHPLVVVAGVSGSGKTTIGTALATRLAVPFVDADDLHPQANVEKMRAGIPLDDVDREPWLDRVGASLASAAATGEVMACSALKRAYRDRLRSAAPGVVFVELTGDPALLAERIGARRGHYMPPSLLASQLAALEPLAPDEPGFTIDVAPTPLQIVDEITSRL